MNRRSLICASQSNRNTDVVEKFFMPVDVTDEFPFMIAKLLRYYNRQMRLSQRKDS